MGARKFVHEKGRHSDVFYQQQHWQGNTIVMILAGVHDSMIQYLCHPRIFLYPWRLRRGRNECFTPWGSQLCITIQSVSRFLPDRDFGTSGALHGRQHITAHGLYRQQGGGQVHVGSYPSPCAPPQCCHGVGQRMSTTPVVIVHQPGGTDGGRSRDTPMAQWTRHLE
jgi:hypothetical protein